MVRLFKHYLPYKVVLLCVVEFILLFVAAELAWKLRMAQIDMAPSSVMARLPAITGYALTVWLALIAVGGYLPESLRSHRFAFGRMLVAVGSSVFVISFVNLLIPGSTVWRSVLLYAMGTTLLLLTANRVLLGRLIDPSTFARRVLILGAGERAKRLIELSHRDGSGFSVAGVIAMAPEENTVPEAVSRASIPDLGKFVARIQADEVVLALQERRNSLPLKDLLRVKTRGVYVSDFSTLLEREMGRVDLDTVNPSWLIFSDGFASGRRLSTIAKRVFDVVVSLLLLLMTWPLILIFGLLVKFESDGPAFYRQIRVGHFGETFEILKLRSMRQDAEAAGAKWAERDDPRITRIGRFIRLVRIDELPQMWSVLKGEMSFVGPRPERPQFVDELEKLLPYYAERHMVKPGITGWAQVNFPYGASMDDARQKLEYDLYYAKNYTPFLDLVILLQTARVIIWPEGAR